MTSKKSTSEKSSKPKRTVEQNQSAPEELPSNSTAPYTITLGESIAARFLWQIRPAPLLRRLILVALVGPIYCFFLQATVNLPLSDNLYIILLSALAGPVLYILVAALVSLFAGAASYQIKKSQFQDTVLHWNEHELVWVSPTYTVRNTWGQFKGHAFSHNLTMLALQGTIIFIPQKAFKTKSDWEKFKTCAAKKAVPILLKSIFKSKSA